MASANSSPASLHNEPAASSAQSSGQQRLSLKRSGASVDHGSSELGSGLKRKGLSYKAKAAMRAAIQEANAAKFAPQVADATASSSDSMLDAQISPNKSGASKFARGQRAIKGHGSRGADSAHASQGKAPSVDKIWHKDHEKAQREVINLDQVFATPVPVGKMVELPVVEIVEQGALVDAKNLGHLFIPHSQLPDELELGAKLKVFVYNEGARFCATVKRPYLQLGMTGLLKVSDIRTGTVYLSLGIPKDLVLPISEQRVKRTPRIGDDMLVLVAIDEQGRLYGSQSFNRFIRDVAHPHEFEVNQSVKVVAVAHTPLGFRVIVDDKVYGLIYSSEQKGELIMGKRYSGFVKAIRSDGRLDVSLQQVGREGIEQAAHDILQALGFSGGFLDFNDRSDPELIEDYLHMSKGKFKKAVGALYKERLIELVDDGIKLSPKGQERFESEHQQLAAQTKIPAENSAGAVEASALDAEAKVDAAHAVKAEQALTTAQDAAEE